MKIIRNQEIQKIRLNYKSSISIIGWFSNFEFSISNNNIQIKQCFSVPEPHILKSIYNDVMKNRGNISDEDLVQMYLKTVAMHSPNYMYINPEAIESITRLEIEEVDIII